MPTLRRSSLPGFGPALGVTLLYLCLLVLIPLCGVFFKSTTLNRLSWGTCYDPGR